MIIPNLTALLEGKQQPRDNDERIAQIGVCRFENRFAALARIYAEAFAADPKLTKYHRYTAARVAAETRFPACAAALAGCGQGKDAADLDDAERARWRLQALEGDLMPPGRWDVPRTLVCTADARRAGPRATSSPPRLSPWQPGPA
jgi:serine/threonine-protein kinase